MNSPQIQAELSLYPLEQQDIAKPIYEFVEALERDELKVYIGTLSTVISGEMQRVFDAVRDAYARVARDGRCVLVVKYLNESDKRED
ncbi:MAG TPA: YkoF family thiamine/hydroxymethylpyrimidine-binding protein [Candidatus Sumerlaeota bacterium]|nr:YkoF family thiamine/hydroxymethylpyrimidine-binding protein [Candidatus Sumerlaeota bacterium]HOR27278.1 YkoF family thiamine/hydroxymethylpyrimidine-binding protein [Candidatus Sumerlaeota bacterium]HPK03663.1 YkoF family thiamine/hydroxymethylpyrimidine-binding protein [Candidatus Sumerlaeota bacterium]